MGLIIGPRKAIALGLSEEIKLISNEEKRQMVSQDEFKNIICGAPLIKSNGVIRKKTSFQIIQGWYIVRIGSVV